MMKFLTPNGVATLVTRTVIIAKCRRLEKKQMMEEESSKGEKEVAVTKVLVNPSFPDQLVTIERGLSKACRDQLECLLIDNMVEEGKFPGYMVTSKGIRANPKKTKALADLQSPRTLKEMQSLSGKLASLNCFLANEETYFRPSIANSTLAKEDLVRIPGGRSRGRSGAGLLLIGPSGIEYTYALRLTFPSTNNEAEYEALLGGLRIARKINISSIEVNVDSKLVASQINGSYEASKDNMMKYLAKAKEYISGFKSFSIENIPRNKNQKADVLSKLDSVAFNHLTKEVLVEVLDERSTERQEAPGRFIMFYQWGMDILGPLPPARGGAKFVIVAIDYFTKWVEAKPVVRITGKELVNDPFKSWCKRPGEFMFRRNEASRVEDQGKLGPKWEGPYRVMEAYENGSYKLQTLDDKEVPRTWHAINLLKCYM
ncbi:reverse transcriptase domain-containing protein [Tanacetum coccineum]